MKNMIAGVARLWDGSWLDRGRAGAAAAILLTIELGAFGFIIAGTHGVIVPLDRPTTTDFVSFYAAGSLADAGVPALAYDEAAHRAAEERATEPGIEYQYFNYPPVFLLLCAVLAQLPYLAAFVLFEAATLALWILVASRILADRSGAALTALLAIPAVWWTVGLGQNALLTASLFGAASLLIDRRPVIAGLLFGALCYKPQFGLLIPVALAAGGEWRAFAAAAASAGALILASLAAFGAETWRAFVATVFASPAIYESGRILFAGMANPFGAARLVGVDASLAYVAQSAACTVAAAIVAATWRARLSLPSRAAVLAAASVVAAPIALLYDLMLAAVAGVWLVRGRHCPAAWGGEKTVLAALCLLLLAGRGVAERWRVPVFGLVALAVLALSAGRAWREAVQRRRSSRVTESLARAARTA